MHRPSWYSLFFTSDGHLLLPCTLFGVSRVALCAHPPVADASPAVPKVHGAGAGPDCRTPSYRCLCGRSTRGLVEQALASHNTDAAAQEAVTRHCTTIEATFAGAWEDILAVRLARSAKKQAASPPGPPHHLALLRRTHRRLWSAPRHSLLHLVTSASSGSSRIHHLYHDGRPQSSSYKNKYSCTLQARSYSRLSVKFDDRRLERGYPTVYCTD